MRPRIKNRVDIQFIINQIEYRISVYSKCIKDIMHKEQTDYNGAKKIINSRTKTKVYENIL